MGSKRVIDYDEYLVAGDMSGTLTGDSTNIMHTDRVGYQILYTGAPNGTFSVEVSNDETTWQALVLSVAIAATGSGDNHFIDVETASKFVRLVYTFSSGTGSLDVKLTAKSISG
tara:strand:- start:3754 stop:4095 length:342 start_codon:yes stop_codon:yes gene_type:complete